MAVGEGDDHAGGAADGGEVGIEGGQEEVVGRFHAADGGLGDAHAMGEFGGLAREQGGSSSAGVTYPLYANYLCL